VVFLTIAEEEDIDSDNILHQLANTGLIVIEHPKLPSSFINNDFEYASTTHDESENYPDHLLDDVKIPTVILEDKFQEFGYETLQVGNIILTDDYNHHMNNIKKQSSEIEHSSFFEVKFDLIAHTKHIEKKKFQKRK
jgi:hypothetical protein